MGGSLTKKRGFSLIEVLMVVAAITLVIGIMMPALFESVEHTETVSAHGRAQVYNTALSRARLAGDNNPAIAPGARDTRAAMAYLIDAGYVFSATSSM